MDALFSLYKENFQLICLLVGVFGVIVGLISVVYEIRKRKKERHSMDG